MEKNPRGILEKIIYNNKLLMVFCVVISVGLWATVKINYSSESVRTISDIKVTIANNTEGNDLVPFYNESELLADVVISGKAYNINSYAISKDDIIVEATSSYIDSAGYKVLNLTVKPSDTGDLSGVEITSVTPSTVSVYYDRKITQSYNVETRLGNELENLVDEEYNVGQPVPSMSTVDVTGPETILDKMTKVYFEASVNEEDLPLKAPKVVDAEVVFDLQSQRGAEYLVCEGINEESNPATVTIPVYVTETLPTQVKFINQPAFYNDNLPEAVISPAAVEVSYNPADSSKYEAITVGTVNFRKLSNKVNTFKFKLDEPIDKALADVTFKVKVDMSSMSRKTFDITGSNIVLLNKAEGYTYTVDTKSSKLDSVVVIGPKKSLSKISAADIQAEINVSSLSTDALWNQSVEISNLSIVDEEIDDCWIYGTYKAEISVEKE